MTSKPAVEPHGLRKAFGEVQALDGLSLAVPAGSVLGLLGPNGSGKTTTVSILATSLRPDAGRATVGGLDVVTEAAQALILGGPAAHDVLISLAWSGGLLVVFALLAARTYARVGR
jgi:ABC-2 type transport system ATP-binding protein